MSVVHFALVTLSHIDEINTLRSQLFTAVGNATPKCQERINPVYWVEKFIMLKEKIEITEGHQINF